MKHVRKLRWCGMIATLVAFVLITLSAAAPVHSHADSSSGACVVCQFDHSPALTASMVKLLPPADKAGAAPPAVALRSPLTSLLTSADGRAPPIFA
jgi:hypothetical protein